MNRKITNYYILGLILLLLTFTYGCGEEKNPSGLVAPVIEQEESILKIGTEQGFLAPDFIINQSGEESISLGELKGKPIFINFWASWCPYCKQELIAVQEMFEKYGDQIHFIAISVRDNEEAAIKLINDFGYTFSVVYDDGIISDLYRIQPIPMNIFIDENGVIQIKVLGAIAIEELEGYLLYLLGK